MAFILALHSRDIGVLRVSDAAQVDWRRSSAQFVSMYLENSAGHGFLGVGLEGFPADTVAPAVGVVDTAASLVEAAAAAANVDAAVDALLVAYSLLAVAVASWHDSWAVVAADGGSLRAG